MVRPTNGSWPSRPPKVCNTVKVCARAAGVAAKTSSRRSMNQGVLTADPERDSTDGERKSSEFMQRLPCARTQQVRKAHNQTVPCLGVNYVPDEFERQAPSGGKSH